MGETDGDTVMVTRTALLDAGAQMRRTGEVDPGSGVDSALAIIVSAPRAHLSVTRITEGSMHRAEVWMSEVGVVALAHQEDDSVAGPIVALPPFDAHQVCVSAMGLDVGSARGDASREVPGGFDRLARAVADGSVPDVTLSVLDWTQGEAMTRWVVADTSDGRIADLAAPDDPHGSLTLVPVSPMELAVSMAAIVTAAITSEPVSSDEDPAAG